MITRVGFRYSRNVTVTLVLTAEQAIVKPTDFGSY